MIDSMHRLDRRYILRLAIPLQHLARGDERLIGDAIFKGFPSLKQIALIAGDGNKEDKKWLKCYWTTIQAWKDKAWARIYPNYPKDRPFPTIEVEYIPAHHAHHMKFDNFAYSSSIKFI
jgi:hypothetical protein